MKQLDKLKKSIKYNKKVILFLIILIMIGIIVGSMFTLILNSSDKSLVVEYIKSFIQNIDKNKLLFSETLINTLIINMIYILFIWVLGLSVIGLPIIILINFWKSFVLGFSISSFIITYGIKGCLLSFFYLFPHLIINLFFIIILSMYSIRVTIKLFNSIIKKKTIDFKLIMNKYTYILLLSTFICILTSLYETFVSHYILKLIVSFLF